MSRDENDENEDLVLDGEENLIEETGPWGTVKSVRPPGSENWGEFVYGYKRAGDILAEHIEDEHRGSTDFLLYPLITIYRHHIELCLKEIIRRG